MHRDRAVAAAVPAVAVAAAVAVEVVGMWALWPLCCIAGVVWVAVAESVAAVADSVGVGVAAAAVAADVAGTAAAVGVAAVVVAGVVLSLLAVWVRLWVHIARIVQLPIALRSIPIHCCCRRPRRILAASPWPPSSPDPRDMPHSICASCSV